MPFFARTNNFFTGTEATFFCGVSELSTFLRGEEGEEVDIVEEGLGGGGLFFGEGIGVDDAAGEAEFNVVSFEAIPEASQQLVLHKHIPINIGRKDAHLIAYRRVVKGLHAAEGGGLFDDEGDFVDGLEDFGSDLIGGNVIGDEEFCFDADVESFLGEVFDDGFADGAVGEGEDFVSKGLDTDGAPADLNDLAHMVFLAGEAAQVHDVADFEGLFRAEGQAGEEVAQGVLEGEAEDDGEDGGGGEEGGDVEVELGLEDREDGEEEQAPIQQVLHDFGGRFLAEVANHPQADADDEADEGEGEQQHSRSPEETECPSVLIRQRGGVFLIGGEGPGEAEDDAEYLDNQEGPECVANGPKLRAQLCFMDESSCGKRQQEQQKAHQQRDIVLCEV